MRLDTTKPVRSQIEDAKSRGVGLFYDLRFEALGDKCASTAVLAWLLQEFDIPEIIIVEAEPGRTSFMLRDYIDNRRLKFITLDPFEEVPGLDLHTTGQSLPALWELNPYLAMKGIRPHLDMETAKGSQFVFAIRIDAEYDARKNMDLLCARKTVDALKEYGEVIVLLEREDPMFPEAPRLNMKECIQHIASARIVIAPDSGFGHCAAALGKQIVSISPDYARHKGGSLAKNRAIGDWWELPDIIYTPTSYLPNSATMKYVELGTDHRFSIADVINAVNLLEG